MSRLQLLGAQLPKLTIPSTPTTFTLFPELPQELRNKIWCHVTNEPGVIHLGCFSDSPVDQLEAPAILHAPTKYDRKEGDTTPYVLGPNSLSPERLGSSGVSDQSYFQSALSMRN
jgi:hypothetical protein